MVSFKHLFHSPKSDGTDVTLVKPTNWNEEHVVTTASDDIVLGRLAGTGPGPVQEVSTFSIMPVGIILPYAGPTSEPSGWLRCFGQSVPRTDFPALFNLIGGTYGAVDASHFSLPDLRGRVITCTDAGAGRIGSYVNGSVGGTGGQESEQAYADVNIAVGSWATGGSYTATGYTTGGQYFDSGDLSSGVEYQGHFEAQGWYGGGWVTPANHTHPTRAYGWTQGQAQNVYINSFGAAGTGGGWTRLVSNMQPTIVLNYIIKMF